MAIATSLSQQFAQRGLQFFKVNKTVTHVCVARPHYLDLETTVVADGVKRIVEFINANPGCTRKKLVVALVPVPYKPVNVVAMPPSPVVAAPPEASAAAAPQGENGAPAMEASAAPAPAAEPAKPPAPEPTPELQALNSDLHWLIHQGHVIEFHTGILETAKKPLPKPPKPTPAAKPVATEPAATPSDTAAVPAEAVAAAPLETTVAPSTDALDLSEAPVAEPEPEPPVARIESATASAIGVGAAVATAATANEPTPVAAQA
jgi:hypothetical protein